MPKNNSAQKRAAREVQSHLGIPYTEALRLVTAAKSDDIHWGQAADKVIQEQGKQA